MFGFYAIVIASPPHVKGENVARSSQLKLSSEYRNMSLFTTYISEIVG